MKFFFYLIFFLISFVKLKDKYCNEINPVKASDCILSEEEKKTFKYCCLEEIDYVKFCYPYDEYNYKLQKETYENSKKKFGTDYIYICNSSYYLKLMALYYALLLL